MHISVACVRFKEISARNRTAPLLSRECEKFVFFLHTKVIAEF
jgi:hypothetical protein